MKLAVLPESATRDDSYLSARSAQRGFVEVLLSLVILSALLLGIAGLNLLLSTQQSQFAIVKHRLLFDALVNRISHVLADQGNCALNLQGIPIGTDFHEKGIAIRDTAGQLVTMIVDSHGRIDNVTVEILKLSNVRPVSGTVVLANLQVSGHLQGQTHTYTRLVPIYLSLGPAAVVRQCRATMLTSKGETVEQKTCQSLRDLELQKRYGTTEECEAYLVRLTQTGSPLRMPASQ